MDNDNLRHGLETIHHKWDDSIAILSGDAMLAIALIRLGVIKENKSIILEKFNEALIKVCEGQALDLQFQGLNDVSVKEYLDMVDKKTGYMIGLSSEIGAIVSNMTFEVQLKFKKYGQLIGRAFQIQDDLLEVISNQEKMGKSLDSDFLLNKKTYLTIKANSIDCNIINRYIEISKNDFNLGFSLYRKFLEDNEIIKDTNILINSITKSARNILAGIDIDTSYLNEFTDLILYRNS
jgi:geranylgeranyl pyrophosphate synthase